MDVTPEKIANIYKECWKIETFFKFIKQNLNVKRLFGTTQNAVYNQLKDEVFESVDIDVLKTKDNESYWFQNYHLILHALSYALRNLVLT